MRPPVDKIAPTAALDDAVLMNSLLDIGGIRASSCNLGFHPISTEVRAII
jgi:hypothetical protein